jgi:hypothetical protein
MKTKTLHRNTPNELRITYTNNEILVENLEDIKLKQEQEKEVDCFLQSLLMMFFAFVLGCCVTYLILN